MATNRKKGSAALFELIDKSGAKSGRHSGSGMKMPEWLEKYNRPQAAPAQTAPGQAATGQPPTNSTTAAPGATSAAGANAAATPGDKPSLTQVYHAPAPATPRETASPRPIVRPNAETPVLLDVLVARFRPWLLFALFIIIFVVIAGLIMLATRRPAAPQENSTANPDTSISTNVNPGAAADNSTPLPPVNPGALPQNNLVPVQTAPAKPVYSVHVGRVVAAADVPRLADHWYLVILTTQPGYAKAAAQFIAKHGVSVTIETGANNLAQVVSVRGFRHRGGQRAIAFRRRVIAIGRLVPGVKRQHDSVWGDAYFVQIDRTH